MLHLSSGFVLALAVLGGFATMLSRRLWRARVSADHGLEILERGWLFAEMKPTARVANIDGARIKVDEFRFRVALTSASGTTRVLRVPVRGDAVKIGKALRALPIPGAVFETVSQSAEHRRRFFGRPTRVEHGAEERRLGSIHHCLWDAAAWGLVAVVAFSRADWQAILPLFAGSVALVSWLSNIWSDTYFLPRND